jgi:hypothetical protein
MQNLEAYLTEYQNITLKIIQIKAAYTGRQCTKPLYQRK